MAVVLVLISDWSVLISNDVMRVTTPNKVSIENWGSETAGNIWSISAIMMWNTEQKREVDLSNGTKHDLLLT